MLVFDRVTHRYEKHQDRVLTEVTFDCRPGQITCLIGPSGCGKTTLLRLAAGLLDLQSGSIELDGEPLAGPNGALPPEQRPVGMVFQEGALFPHLTVAGNVGFGIDGDQRARVTELLEQMGLTAFAGRYPESLSGGQRQR
ncbi:MAG: ATP-binding cassette domain-containing protein, partial [Pseudomonadota bacterium]